MGSECVRLATPVTQTKGVPDISQGRHHGEDSDPNDKSRAPDHRLSVWPGGSPLHGGPEVRVLRRAEQLRRER